MSYYSSNLSTLKKNDNLKSLWTYWKRCDPKPIGKPICPPLKTPNLAIEKDGELHLLHMEKNPEAEIPQFLRLVPLDSHGIVVMFGMGLGYSPLAILRERPHIRHLFIFEAEPGILRRAMELMDLSPLLSSEKVTIYLPETWDIRDCLQKCGAGFRVEDVHFLHHLPSVRLDSAGFYKSAYDTLFQVANAENITGNTFAAFGVPITDNRFEHLKLIPFHPFIDELKDVFCGIPAILVAAGPSLDKNIDKISDAMGKAVIFAVDSAVPALLKRRIYPDFVCSIDFQEITFEKLSHVLPMLHARPPRFICTLWNAPSMFKRCPWKEIYRVLCHHAVDYWINEQIGPKTIFPGAETVAHLNLLSAIFTGCSPIILVGQDLAYGSDRSHSSDVLLKAREKPEELITVKGNVEDEVVTDRSFFGMIKSFENMMRANPNRYINATEGGAYIEGTEIQPLSAAIEKWCRTPINIDAHIKYVDPKKTISTSIKNGTKKLIKTIKKNEDAIRRSNKLTSEIIDIIHRHKIKSLAQLNPKYREKIFKLEKINEKLDKDNLLWRFVECITINSFKVVERMKRAVNEAEDMDYGEYVKRSLDRTSFVNRERLLALSWLRERLQDVLDFIEKYQRLDNLSPSDKIEFMKHHGMFLMLNDFVNKHHDKLIEQLGEDGNLILQYELAVALRKPEEAQECLSKLEHLLGPDRKGELQDIQNGVAREFALFAERFASINRSTTKALLLRGLSLAPDSEILRKYLANLSASDYKAVQGKEVPVRDVATEWSLDTLKFPYLMDIVSREHLSFFLWNGIDALIDRGQYDDAQKLLLLSEEKTFLPEEQIIELKLRLSLAKNDCEAAIAILKHGHASPSRWREIGLLCLDAGRYQEAIGALEEAFLGNPEDIELIGVLTECYMKVGSADSAAASLTKLRERLRRSQPRSKES